MSGTRQALCAETEMGVGDVRGFQVGSRAVALYRLKEGFFATDDICTHGHAYLSDGYIDGDNIECPLHAGCFNIRTGAATVPPCVEPIETFPVEVVDGQVYVTVT